MADQEITTFYYAGPPRTATSWVMAGLATCGWINYTNGKLPWNLQWKNMERWWDLTVMTVRHPCRWLTSYYASYPSRSLLGFPEFDCFAQLDRTSFDHFLNDYLETMPGAVGRLYASYGADASLRVEDLPYSFYAFLKTMGVPARIASRTIQIPPVNIGRQLVWSPGLKARVKEAEQDIMERLDYW